MKKRIAFAVLAVTVICAAVIFVWYRTALGQKPTDEIVVNDKDEAIYDSLTAVGTEK